MASSEFWRNLANEFRSIRAHIPEGCHWAEWNSPGSDLPNGWMLSEHYPFRMEFIPLALRAGHALIPDAPNPWFAWLDALKNYNPPSLKVVDKSRDIGVIDADGKEIRWVAGELHNLCHASTDFCKALEIAAILNEAAAAQQEPAFNDSANVLAEDGSETTRHTERLKPKVPSTLAQTTQPQKPFDKQREALLADYKGATGSPSNRRIYKSENAPINKPEFYAWLHGELAATSKTAIKFANFLRRKKPPIL